MPLAATVLLSCDTPDVVEEPTPVALTVPLIVFVLLVELPTPEAEVLPVSAGVPLVAAAPIPDALVDPMAVSVPEMFAVPVPDAATDPENAVEPVTRDPEPDALAVPAI